MKRKVFSLMLSVLMLISMFSCLQALAAGMDVIKYTMFENTSPYVGVGFKTLSSWLRNGTYGVVSTKSRTAANSSLYTDASDYAIAGFGYISTIKTYTNGWTAVGSAFCNMYENEKPDPKDISDCVANGVIKMEICFKNSEVNGKLSRNDFYVIMASYDSETQKYSYNGINLRSTNYVDCAAGHSEFMPVSVPISSLTDLDAIPNDTGAPGFDFKNVVFVGLAFKPEISQQTNYIDTYVDNIKIYSDISPVAIKFYEGTTTTTIQDMITGTVTVKGQAEPNATGKLIVAKYNAKKEMNFLEIVDIGINKAPTVSIPSCQSTDIIKTFVFDNLENIKPMSGITQLPQIQ